MHSTNYEKVRMYYEQKLWSIERVRNAIGKWITDSEYHEIVVDVDA